MSKLGTDDISYVLFVIQTKYDKNLSVFYLSFIQKLLFCIINLNLSILDVQELCYGILL